MSAFEEELQYMGNNIFIKDKRIYVKPLQSRLDAIQKLKPPMIVKGCKVLWNGKFLECILSRITEVIKTNI